MLQGLFRSQHCFFASLGMLALIVVAAPAYAIDWQPISPDDLQMKSEPKAPDASAIYLYLQVDRNDELSIETFYARIKVLTEEGRKYADIEIPYAKESEGIRGLDARTIRPDGTIVEFNGTIYDKPLIKARSYKMMAKTFTLPNVEVGSIIEYRYRKSFSQYWVFNSRWILSHDLFTRHAVFSLVPSTNFALRWSWPLGLPEGTESPKKVHDVIRLDTHDVPAFITEEHMPPEDVMKFRVEFVYEEPESEQKDEKAFWAAFGKRKYKKLESFIDSRRAMEKAAAEIVQSDDSNDTKVRKLYARAQQIRNLSFERSKTEQEAKREDLATIRDAEDIWTHGYGDGVQITWLFLALVRAAHIEADAVLVPTRDDYFFSPRSLDARQLNSNVVIVKLDGREIYLDPGTPFTPFGFLPWAETGVNGLRLDKDGGTWVVTPLPRPEDSRVKRQASMTMTASGSLEGKLTVTYTGLEASSLRLIWRNEDETSRTEGLENGVKADVPTGIDLKLTNTPDWSGSETPLIAEFDLKMPGYAAKAGKRALLPVGLFGAGVKHTFEHAERVHPIYFAFPYQQVDEIAVQLPAGWQISSVPNARSADINVARYYMTSRSTDGSLSLKRVLISDMTLVQSKYYGQLRDFFQTVRAGDQDQAVVSQGAAPAVSPSR
jgi:hypothetical protein